PDLALGLEALQGRRGRGHPATLSGGAPYRKAVPGAVDAVGARVHPHRPMTSLPARMNDAYQARNALGRRKLYLNWGLWDETTEDVDDAALALVLRLGELAGLGPETTLLDVGFGFGDQLVDWCRHLGLRHAEGVNVCPEQTEIARGRLVEAGLADRVRVRVGD